MPRRQILTERQRSALLDLPTDDASLLQHYTLADDDLVHIGARRRDHNRLGFALQLCALRHPGRLLSPGEVIPQEVAQFLAAQLGLGQKTSLTMPCAKKPATNTLQPCARFTATRPFRAGRPAIFELGLRWRLKTPAATKILRGGLWMSAVALWLSCPPLQRLNVSVPMRWLPCARGG